jgi:hypothetical protein
MLNGAMDLVLKQILLEKAKVGDVQFQVKAFFKLTLNLLICK